MYVHLAGWLGSILILWCYMYITKRQVADTKYHIVNLLSCVLMLINVWHYRSMPAVFLNSAWILIALTGIRKELRPKTVEGVLDQVNNALSDLPEPQPGVPTVDLLVQTWGTDGPPVKKKRKIETFEEAAVRWTEERRNTI